MPKYPKHIQRQLRELARLVTERELGAQLLDLYEKFEDWRGDKISNRELRHILHTFVDGPSRELFRHTQNLPDDILVADAIARGILSKDGINEELMSHIQNGIRFYHDTHDGKSN